MTTPRVAILAGLFVAGGLAGAGGTALLATDIGAPTDLVAGERVHWDVGPNGGVTAAIDVYNPDERSADVEPVAIGGWDAISRSSEPINAAPRAWSALTFEVIPDCGGDVARTLDLVADDVLSEIDLTDDVVDMLDMRRRGYCGEGGITLQPAVEERSWDGNTHVLDVRVPGHGRAGLGDLTIVQAAAGAPYIVEVEGLPVDLPAEDSITLTTRWTFDCDLEPADLAEPMIPGGVISYEAIYLTTSDDIQIYADVSTWLIMARGRACADVP